MIAAATSAAGPLFVLGIVAVALIGVLAACVAAGEADAREDAQLAAEQEAAARAVLYDHSPPSIDVGRTTDPRGGTPTSLAASSVGRAPDADRRSGLGMRITPCSDGYVWEVLHDAVVVADGLADSRSEAVGEARRVIRRGGVTA